EIAKEREEKILRMIVQEFVETRKPVGSELVAQKGLPGVSSATIRNAMKKLEDEGYLFQPHASGGRIPTDKAYRFYVDYLSKIQKIAAKEREKIEKEYRQNTDEINRVMAQTSRMLSMLSGSAGFVLQSSVQDSVVQRLDFIPLGPFNVLAVLVTKEGVVKHWPVKVGYAIAPTRLLMLSAFINEQISGRALYEAQRILWQNLQTGHGDIDGFSQLAFQILKEMTAQQTSAERLYIEGMSQLLENVETQEYGEVSKMLRVMEDRDRFAGFLGEIMQDMQRPGADKKISVSIGAENELSELKNISIITSAYQAGDKTLGILGIVGPKHMEYGRMMSIVNFIGGLLTTTIENWASSLENQNDKEKNK
ncbi:MAG: heat-inducible transcriptional repressor HrcA, partial [Elusimicrobiota bacterium]|nr:heat-inducible transcriptional repressor HrcA [Elusimicrobiota bacterium]